MIMIEGILLSRPHFVSVCREKHLRKTRPDFKDEVGSLFAFLIYGHLSIRVLLDYTLAAPATAFATARFALTASQSITLKKASMYLARPV